MQPPEHVAFILGAVGSLALEFVMLLQAFHRGKLPSRYKSIPFWIVRVIMSGFGGIIAWAYYSPALHPILYVHIGAATPVLLMQFASSPPPDPPSPTGRAEPTDPSAA